MTRQPQRPDLGPEGRPTHRASLGLAVGALLFAGLLIAPAPPTMPETAWRTAAVAVLMAVWWMTEAIPVAATALLPIALFPLVGVADVGDATAPFANPIIFLFLGGFLIAIAIERWNLHRRIALAILAAVGSRAERIVGGFLLGTALLSMWLSNTATTVMMLPIALSVLGLLEGDEGPGGTGPGESAPGEGEVAPDFGVALLLGLAYGASIGGIATLVGTPPNAMLAAYFDETYGVTLGFGRWMLLGLPISAVLLVTTWWLLTRWLVRVEGEIPGAAELIRRERAALGGWSVAEVRVACVFGATAAGWILRPRLESLLPGISISDAGIAVLAAVVLFVIPVERRGGRTVYLMSWREAERVPWGVLLLFGGGLSLAERINQSGLGDWVGGRFAELETWPTLLLLLLVVATIVFLTELTSNAATTATFLPVLAAMAVSLGESPLMFAVPAAVGASCAFMMPVATPPNAIVYGSGRLTIPQMARVGLWLNLVAIVVVVLAGYFVLGLVFGVTAGEVPSWASPTGR